jgi:hypothetical protein
MTDIVERAKTCGADGDAIYCWNVAREVADECISLRQQLADLEQQYVALNEASIAAINGLKQQLAECQADNKRLREVVESFGDEWGFVSKKHIDSRLKALVQPPDSTALDASIRQAKQEVLEHARQATDTLINQAKLEGKREALLEAANLVDNMVRLRFHIRDIASDVRNMAKELE